MLGKDADRNEYWHFKEDAERIYVRIEESPEVRWFYIDEEDKFDTLVESMNPRGIRERKLLDSLKKSKDRLKLRKTKKLTPLSIIA
jgi:benzoyl-CoA reductase/2-hydroxyglutaryl-CoA dehydratase subunit BcrC/BadD/HgdB